MLQIQYFGYADDVSLYRASHSLDTNVEQLGADIREINDWGDKNKVVFAPEKLEMIHLSRRRDNYAPSCVVDEDLTIEPILPGQDGDQPALRWLGVWFDRKLTFKRHVAIHTTKARIVAQHLQGLAQTKHGPLADSLRRVVISCILPSLMYGTECWYSSRTKPPRTLRATRPAKVSARLR